VRVNHRRPENGTTIGADLLGAVRREDNCLFVGSSHEFVGAAHGNTNIPVFLFHGKPGSDRVHTGILNRLGVLPRRNPQIIARPGWGDWRGFRTRKVYHRGVVCSIHSRVECGKVRSAWATRKEALPF
jgi:hypothetical protein